MFKENNIVGFGSSNISKSNKFTIPEFTGITENDVLTISNGGSFDEPEYLKIQNHELWRKKALIIEEMLKEFTTIKRFYQLLELKRQLYSRVISLETPINKQCSIILPKGIISNSPRPTFIPNSEVFYLGDNDSLLVFPNEESFQKYLKK